MIRYALQCADGHRFESWFQSGASFERLKSAGHLSCAICGVAAVEKAIMAPAVSAAAPGAPAPAPAPDRGPETLLSAPANALETALRALRAHVEANAENVGDRFADEARAIHDGAADARAIYGQATKEDARALIEEGVEISALPWPLRRDS